MQIPHPEQFILLDIETVSQYPDFRQMPENWKHMWQEKIGWMIEGDKTAEEYYSERAAIMAEFGKIICISVGYFREENQELQLRLKSFAGHDEKLLLEQFLHAIGQLIVAKKMRLWFGGHNIREFDIPYLCRRLLIHNITLPQWFDFQAMKPWDVPMLDTMQLWKFGDYKHFTSLNLLAACLGIDSPKDDINGSMVGAVYWKENGLERIAAYCEKDVITVGQLLLRFSNRPLLMPNQVLTV
jgi:DNA polymerase elongation subunit (family B)